MQLYMLQKMPVVIVSHPRYNKQDTKFVKRLKDKIPLKEWLEKMSISVQYNF